MSRKAKSSDESAETHFTEPDATKVSKWDEFRSRASPNPLNLDLGRRLVTRLCPVVEKWRGGRCTHLVAEGALEMSATVADQGFELRPSSRSLMIFFWISLVPSKIVVSRASRQ